MIKPGVVFKQAFGKKELNKDMVGNLRLEKNDFLALVIAGGTVFLPALLLMFGGIALLILFLFYR